MNEPKKYLVTSKPEVARRYGSRQTAARPSRTSSHTARDARADGGGSGLRMSNSDTADATNESASTTIAATAEKSWTIAPASAGATDSASAPDMPSFALPSTTRSRPTREGRYERYATSKNAPSTAVPNTTARSSSMRRAPAIQAK